MADKTEQAALTQQQQGLFSSLVRGFGEANLRAQQKGTTFTQENKAQLEIMHNEQEMTAATYKRFFEHVNQNGVYILGFEPPRRAKDVPITIEKTFDHRHIDWDKNDIRIEGLHFVEVRICELPKISVIDQPKVGRPSMKRDLEECIDALYKEGAISPKGKLVAHFPVIRQRLCISFPEKYSDTTPSNETIRNYLSRYFSSF
ncbi:hypothetical protein [Nereida sp. MMG025]|uniref:hypothetical protein n=1 Tax=Nereida sp. MMG025 TaxID=2909981 RepID=UPI001F15E329|nr:hypothetical protein [Nereida sp. MMG025]MCF6443692.1 hypothetical protein [Nereida sp. MMG025]